MKIQQMSSLCVNVMAFFVCVELQDFAERRRYALLQMGG